MRTWTVYWAPEGRPLFTIEARNWQECKRYLRAHFPQHARYLGEVYAEVTG